MRVHISRPGLFRFLPLSIVCSPIISYIYYMSIEKHKYPHSSPDKFGELIDSKYADYLQVIDECLDICHYFIHGASSYPDQKPIIQTLTYVQTLSLEYIDSIILNLRKGFITQAIVLIRSLFELSNLYTYVYMDEEHHKKWVKEKRIRPNVIRRTLKKQGFDPGKKTYSDLSKFSHANYEFITEHQAFYASAPVNDMQTVFIPKCLIDMMRFVMRICLVSCKIYAEHIEKAQDIIQLKNEHLDHLHENVLVFGEEQARTEDEYIEFKKLLERMRSRHFED
jgi:hypothetical protein